jgi:hypothetical protein
MRGRMRQIARWYGLRQQFREEFNRFKAMADPTEPRFALRWGDRYPCLNDKTGDTLFDRHYVLHTAWAARILSQIRPPCHVDISSSLFFCSIVSAFVPVKFYDYRPPALRLNGLSSGTADLLALPFEDRAITSLSSMHVIEHVGLGRYGEPLDPDGDLKAMAELKRVLAVGGDLLIVVPVGKPKIMFNAHRIYSHNQVKSYFADLHLQEFALIPDDPKNGDLVHGATEQLIDSQTYACGCYWFKKA